ncbi:hypothetical protein FD724_06820 [Nostoc sp. C057]|uniref:hypothetical protein n=1 Tax=Nostoc sp. C057 TaxID=2576903 RepID=UPI0015C346DD|nr:hypothetical protein [Nostoc sp. C057]QLE47851.1 hypothetical protein FD724_06820 [Nostoc sp. C057]
MPSNAPLSVAANGMVISEAKSTKIAPKEVSFGLGFLNPSSIDLVIFFAKSPAFLRRFSTSEQGLYFDFAA